jgi:phasin family protein
MEHHMLTPEQFASTQKANIQTLIDLTGKAFQGAESLVALNMQTAKAALSEAEGSTITALSAKDPQSLFALQYGALQPSAEKATAYFRETYDIANTVKAEFTKVFGAAAASAQGSFTELFDAAAKNVPAGSENGLALWKSAIATAGNAFESMQKAAQQATDVAEANYTAVTTQAVKATKGKRG